MKQDSVEPLVEEESNLKRDMSEEVSTRSSKDICKNLDDNHDARMNKESINVNTLSNKKLSRLFNENSTTRRKSGHR